MNIKQRIKNLLMSTCYEAFVIANEKQMFHIAVMELKKQCVSSLEMGITTDCIADHDVIVSLTTYSKRFYDVFLTIESIMQGTLKPNKLVLWLAEDMKELEIPLYLQRQITRGLEIRYCEDLKSYKKLIPTLKEYPNSIIVTIDDDVIYEADMLEKLVNAYKKDSHHIYANRVNRISLNKEGKINKYIEWTCVKNVGVSTLNFFTGVGGVLYPPNCFVKEIFNEEAFLSLAPCGDDIWFYAMALLNGYTVGKVYTHDENGNDFLVNEAVQDISLYHINTEGNMMNDKQIKAVFDKYDIYNLLKE